MTARFEDLTALRALGARLRASGALPASEPTQRPYADVGAGHEKAATWHEWGAFLGELFHRDPEASCDYYDDARDFEAKAVRPWMDPPDEARTLEDWRTMFAAREAVS